MKVKKDPFKYLDSLEQHTVKPGLERISNVLKAEGNPHLALNTVLIAGTNGKTSTASILAEILTAGGFSIGLYTSPHLIRLGERIKISGREIPISVLGELLCRARRLSENLNLQMSYFETLTAAAFIYFKEKRVDAAVFEVGMGGRWDAVNVAQPVVSAITNISMDHMRYLGSTLEEIALEKAGIIKRETPLVTAAGEVALGVIEKKCEEKRAPIFRNEKEFFCSETENGAFNYAGPRWTVNNIRPEIKGSFQRANACVALACAEVIDRLKGFNIPPERVRKAVGQTRVVGRMEYARTNPPFIIDGAHNPASARHLVESLGELHRGLRFVFVIAMSGDKDHAEFIKQIAPVCLRLILTRSPDGKSAQPETLRKFAPTNTETEIAATPERALEKARQTALPCCVTGSLYFAGEVKKLISRPDFSIEV